MLLVFLFIHWEVQIGPLGPFCCFVVIFHEIQQHQFCLLSGRQFCLIKLSSFVDAITVREHTHTNLKMQESFWQGV